MAARRRPAAPNTDALGAVPSAEDILAAADAPDAPPDAGVEDAPEPPATEAEDAPEPLPATDRGAAAVDPEPVPTDLPRYDPPEELPAAPEVAIDTRRAYIHEATVYWRPHPSSGDFIRIDAGSGGAYTEREVETLLASGARLRPVD